MGHILLDQTNELATMFNKALSTAAVALAAARLVSAQTFTECNPLEKSEFS